MSVEAISWALTQPIKHSTAKFVLVALANCADGQDFAAWPSLAYLADATGQDRKTVQANMNRLRELGYIEDTGERKGSTKQVIVYRLKEPENGIVKEAQNRNTSKTGTHPKLDSKRPVFPHKEAQISHETGPKTGHGTVIEPSLNRQGTVKKTTAQKSQCIPDDFGISERVRKWAADKGHANLQAHLEYFAGYARANAKKYADWDEAFMNAIRGNWAKVGTQASSNQPRSGKFDPSAYVNRNRNSIPDDAPYIDV